MNQEENKDIQSIKTVFIVLGVLIICFALGFFIGRRYLVPEPQPEVIEPVEVEIDVEDASIKDLIPQLVSGGDCWNIEIYANDHKVTTKDLSNETLFNVTAFSKFYAKGIDFLTTRKKLNYEEIRIIYSSPRRGHDVCYIVRERARILNARRKPQNCCRRLQQWWQSHCEWRTLLLGK